MNKSKIITILKEHKIVVVVRGDSKEEGINCAKACIKGKIQCIEVAYTNNFASDIIRDLIAENEDNKDICIGAGTVLDAPTAKNAIEAGAQYIVSPSFNKETAILCNRYGVVYIPGCMTIREIIEAMESGSEIVKLFPGSAFGSSYIKAIMAPLPQASLMITGGVNLNNAKEWLAAGANVIGIGGEFNTLAKQNDFDSITSIAHQFVSLVNNT